MKKLLLLTVGFVSFAFTSLAQPSITLSVGSALTFGDDDTYSLTKGTFPNPGTQTEDGIGFFSGMSGLHLKAGVGWEISDHFSAGLAFQMLNLTSEENFRTADITSLGVQFRVNLSSSQKQWVPFLQGAYYFSNAQTYDQKQTTQGTLTQPAIAATGSTSLGFNFDFGLEYKIMKSMGLQFTVGLNGVDPIPDVPAGTDYSPYYTPEHFNGGLSMTFAGGIKYYFGRGDKKRDF